MTYDRITKDMRKIILVTVGGLTLTFGVGFMVGVFTSMLLWV